MLLRELIIHISLQNISTNRRCLSVQGPDVTLATNAFSSMSFNTTLEIPDISGQRAEIPFLESLTKPSRYDKIIIYLFKYRS